jgi:hypothetical protein
MIHVAPNHQLMKIAFILPACTTVLLLTSSLMAQEVSKACKVSITYLQGSYTGECRNGLANGKGEAKGAQYYSGTFKDGVPHGEGTWHYNDAIYYTGHFQDGIKEGKGEIHFRKPSGDSVVKGYWSGDEYRGKRYLTYKATGLNKFDQADVIPTEQSGNSITFETTTTTGAPNGAPMFLNSTGTVITIRDLIISEGVQMWKVSDFASANKWSVTYGVSKFPLKLLCTFSNNERIELELYKSADWKIRLYSNR